MKVVIAPDSFKDALRANEAATQIATGLMSVVPNMKIDSCPVADGGEGFADAIAQAPGTKTTPNSAHTVDPLGRPIEARWLTLKQPTGKPIAAVELAEASGLERLAEHERNPLNTSTFGTGALLYEAIELGVDTLLLGIGGSATNDAGCGLAQALGVRFIDSNGNEIDQPISGGMLTRIARIDRNTLGERFEHVAVRVACDVDNPLTGPNGAAQVYGPQKGASPAQAEQLDSGLRHIAQLWRDQLGIDVEQRPGAGAAGGVGGGLVAMLGAELVPGADLVLDTIGFDERIKDTDLVITGEGRLDSQSLNGKAAMAVAKRCKAAGVPCVALVGSVGEGADEALELGLTDYRVIGEGLEPSESIRRTGQLLEQAAARLIRDMLA